MALTEQSMDDKIEVVGDFKMVHIRTARVIYDDGAEISRGYKRRIIEPAGYVNGTWSNTDISGESSEIQAVCNAVWTDAVRTAFKAHIDAQES